MSSKRRICSLGIEYEYLKKKKIQFIKSVTTNPCAIRTREVLIISPTLYPLG